MGVDLVTCQHSHCIGTVENYKNSTIVYGQGNTLFGYRKDDLSWNQGLILKLIFKKSFSSPNIKLIPISATNKGIMLMNDKDSTQLIDQINKRSLNLNNSNFVLQNWKEFCFEKKDLYMPYLFGFGKYFIYLNRILKNKIVSILYGSRAIRTSKNIVRCESHYEVIQTILNDYK